MTTLEERAVDFLQRKLEERSTRTTILALGPLTNVARLLRLHPDTPRHVSHLVVMGGAVGVPGNVTPYAEFNFYSDPTAAGEVPASGMEITLVDLRVCRQAAISRQGAARLNAGGPAARLAGRILSGWFQRNPDKDTYELCDPVAMAAVLEPGILSTRRGRVDVETRQGDRLGETTFVEGRGTVRVSTALDTERFFKLFYRTLGAPAIPL
jgi:inosine-uridine nucleoside N-ribohydrolase